MRELEYPFDPGYIMKKRRSIKKELLKTDKPFIEKRIAVLGGSTTHDIIDILELFLLNYGIRPTFYCSLPRKTQKTDKQNTKKSAREKTSWRI